MGELQLGVYRHYKGNFYRVLFTARDSENGPAEGRTLVVYLSLTYGTTHVRPLAQFIEMVPTGDGNRSPRFTCVGDRVPT